jgi:hypothetical protein
MEILNKRTLTSKHFDNGDGTFTAHCGSGPRHYKEAGEWTDIDTTPVDMGAYWAFEKANHKLYINKDFGANNLIRFDNKMGDADHTMKFEPHSLVWINSTDFSDKVDFRVAQSVQGVINENNIVVYKDAFGPGLDYEVAFAQRGIEKNLVINAKTDLEQPPTPNHKLVLLSRFTGDNLAMKEEGVAWDKETYKESTGLLHLRTGNETEKTILRQALIWDENDQKVPIKMFWTKRNNRLWQGKVLPSSFLRDAVYPVRTDTTIDTYDATNSGQNNRDNDGSNYNTTCTNADGKAVVTLSLAIQNLIHDSKIGGAFYLRRADLIFDTSSIGSGNVVSASALSIYCETATTASAQGYTMYFLDNTNNGALASPMTTADYDDFESDTANAVGSEAWTALDVSGDTQFDMDTHAWINITGDSRLGIRSGNEMLEQLDGTATAPTGTNVWRVLFNTDAPYVVVTYAPSATNAVKSINGLSNV